MATNCHACPGNLTGSETLQQQQQQQQKTIKMKNNTVLKGNVMSLMK